MTFLNALADHHSRLIQQGHATPPGLGPVRLGYALVLDKAGRLVSVESLLREKRKATFLAPKAPQRSNGVRSGFLWDKPSYVLGVREIPLEPNARKSPERVAQEHSAFVELHMKALAQSADPSLQALCRFLETWSPKNRVDPELLGTISGHNLCFRISGEAGLLHENPAALELARSRALAGADLEIGQCAMTGEIGRLARLHPRIVGFPGAISTGASLVTHATPAVRSFGALQGENAPVLASRAVAYGEALDILIAGRASAGRGAALTNRIQLGEDTLIFWAESEAAESAIRMSLGMVTDDPGVTALSLENDLHAQNVWLGLLSPNGGRLYLRRSFCMTLGSLRRRLEAFLASWTLLGPRPPQLELWRISQALAPQAAFDPAASKWAGELCAAILDGRSPPRGLLTYLMLLIARDRNVSGMRAGMIKACLLEGWQQGACEGDIPDWGELICKPAYDLGQIYACLSAIQAWGEGAFAVVGDHDLISTASARPAQILVSRVVQMRRRLKVMSASGSPGRTARLGRELEHLIESVGGMSAIPQTLDLSDRALFLVGFYMRRRSLKEPIQRATQSPDLASGRP